MQKKTTYRIKQTSQIVQQISQDLNDVTHITANYNIDSFSEFEQVLVNNMSDLHFIELMIETNNHIDSNYWTKQKHQRVFQVSIDGVTTSLVDRNFIQDIHFIRIIEGVVFENMRIIHTSKQTFIHDFTSKFKIHPKITKSEVWIVLSFNMHSKFSKQVQVRMGFPVKSISNMSNLEEINSFKNEVTDIKSRICECVKTANWRALFEMQDKHTLIRSFVSSFPQGTPIQPLSSKNISDSLIVCKYRDSQYVEIMTFLQEVYRSKQLVMDIKRLLRNPRNIKKEDIIRCYPWKQFIFSPKADGTRCLLVLLGLKQYLVKEKMIHRLEDSTENRTFVLEVEQLGNQLLCYDMHLFEGESVVNKQYIHRLDLLSKFVQFVPEIGDYKLQVKQFAIVTPEMGKPALKDMIHRIMQQPYTLDGLIINSNSSYNQQQIYKWKPREKMSIDLYVDQIPKNKLPETFSEMHTDKIPLVLFTHIDYKSMKFLQFETMIKVKNPSKDDNLILIPFQPSLCPRCYIHWREIEEEEKLTIIGKVCEFTFNQETKKWIFMRVREDKDPRKGQFGNFYSTAESTFCDIINYLDISCLYDISFKSTMYFQTPSQMQYKAMIKYMNFVKRAMINSVCNPNIYPQSVVLDIGTGRGQDINKYAANKVKKLICVDNDVDAIQELIQRKNDTKVTRFPIIEAHILDFTNKDIIAEFVKSNLNIHLDTISCQFAFHYFIHNIDSMESLFGLVRTGGFVIMTVLDGKQIFDMLKSTQEQILEENGQIKYQYVKLYKDTKILDSGQLISVKLPFSNELRSEQLVNVKYLNDKMHKFGFQVYQQFTMDLQGSYQHILKDDIAELFKMKQELSQTDQNYVGLYKALIYMKKK